MPASDDQILVKLTADLAAGIPYQDDVISLLPADIQALWAAVMPGMTLDRALPLIDPDALRNKLAENELATGTPSENLLAFFVVAVPQGMDAEAVASTLRSMPFVEAADVQRPLMPAGVNYADDPLVAGQGYLGPKPVGIGSLVAWTKAGGDGTGVKFVDLEYGFLLNHEDLVDPAGNIRITTLPTGPASTDPSHLDHSTAVLGVVLATDNTKGIVGIAPNVQAFAAPAYPGLPVVLDAVLIAIWLNPTFGAGTVVLIEFQDLDCRPVETDLFVRSTIRELTRSGMTVVVPAGNGGHDLNGYTAPQGQIFDRNSPAFFDSGAIMVAAANPGLNDRYVGLGHGPSCHGNRIDCFAWGDGIMTASALPTTPGGLNGYTDGISSTSGLFGGTSGASAIIAGAAISLQGMRLARYGAFLSSAEVRGLLKDLTLNTSPAPGDVGRLGAMPDLERLAQHIGAT